jgi:hypothetical protein
MSTSSPSLGTERRLTTGLLLVVLLVAGLATPALARATTTEFAATLTFVSPPEIEREWVSGPIWHVRGAAVTLDLDGDLTGSAALVHNVNINLTTEQGTGFGTIVIAADAVTWEGRYRGTYTDFLFAGTLVLQGSDGTVMRGTIAALDPDTVTLEGVILDPHGD